MGGAEALIFSGAWRGAEVPLFDGGVRTCGGGWAAVAQVGAAGRGSKWTRIGCG